MHEASNDRRDLAQAHVLVLKLPVKLCVDRVAARVNHEGGLEGGEGASVVYRMHGAIGRAGLPSASEGFASITVHPLSAHSQQAPSVTVTQPCSK